ncbi:Alpha/Beta hydrolase protein [Xylaria cf. heliscus]|nr:Alpha/Beta hydrolase protein [Xylaria cf. heliscus]
MARITAFLALVTLLGKAVALPANTTPGPIVTLNNVRYLGHYNTTLNTHEYYSIPFAAAPIGPLRWKAPQPYIIPSKYTNSKTPIDVTKPGPSCVQGIPFSFLAGGPATFPVAGSEDCLTLHVYTPDTATAGANLPVLFNIHGGGYTTGQAGMDDPHALMRHSKNAFIFVSIQYRLGAYGFAGGPTYVREGGAQNVGLLDQRLALEWTQKNIAAFGGDPKKVTIVGGSAGGASVTAHLAWKGGVEHPPFRAAIADYPFLPQFLSGEQLDKQFHVLLDATGCVDLRCLRGIPEDILKNATQNSYATAYAMGLYGYGNFYYGPYVDGEAVRHLPSREFKAERFARVPTWVSREGYEGVLFSNQSMTTIEEEKADLRTQFPSANETFVDRLYELYPSEDFNSTFWHRQTWFGDFIIDCPTRYIGASIAATDTPVFKLVFDAGTQIHLSEGPFLNDLNYASGPGANITIANVVKDFYLSFAIHLNPNAESWSNVLKPVWPDYKSGKVMSINYTEIGAVSDVYYDNTDRCRFFQDNDEIIQN